MSQIYTQSFPKFGHLPTEIQNLIWGLALESPPAAHFADLDDVSFSKPTRAIEAPKGRRKWHTLEVLIKFGPRPTSITSGHSNTAPHALLLQTCRASRRVAFRLANAWGPGRALQLYAGERSTLHDIVSLIELKGCSAGGDGGERQNNRGHGEYPLPETIDVPSLWVDGTQDFVIIPKGWEREAERLQCCIYDFTWTIPIQRARYIGLEWPYSGRRVFESLACFLFSRFRCDALYVILGPDELAGPPDVHKMAPELAREQRQTLEQRFKRPGVPTEDLAAHIPDRFWRGKREFYVVSWEDIERRMVDSPCWDLIDITAQILEIRKAEDDVCKGCQDIGCDLKPDMFPIAWRIMSWRDKEEQDQHIV